MGVVVRVLLVLLPVILYLLWLRYLKQKRLANERGDAAALEEAQRQLSWAVGIMAVLIALTFGYLAFSTGEDPAREYIPPHVEDGRVVPGGFRERDVVPPDAAP